jgi:hypothetical protein
MNPTIHCTKSAEEPLLGSDSLSVE